MKKECNKNNGISPNIVISSIHDNTYDDLLAELPDVFKDQVQTIAHKVGRYIAEMKKLTPTLYTTMITAMEMDAAEGPYDATIYDKMYKREHDPNDPALRKMFYIELNKHDKFVKSHLKRIFDKMPEDYLQNEKGKYVRYDDMDEICMVMRLLDGIYDLDGIRIRCSNYRRYRKNESKQDIK